MAQSALKLNPRYFGPALLISLYPMFLFSTHNITVPFLAACALTLGVEIIHFFEKNNASLKRHIQEAKSQIKIPEEMESLQKEIKRMQDDLSVLKLALQVRQSRQ